MNQRPITRWSHWRWFDGDPIQPFQVWFFGRELGDDEELCPDCKVPVNYDWHDWVLRWCPECGRTWLYDQFECEIEGIRWQDPRERNTTWP